MYWSLIICKRIHPKYGAEVYQYPRNDKIIKLLYIFIED